MKNLRTASAILLVAIASIVIAGCSGATATASETPEKATPVVKAIQGEPAANSTATTKKEGDSCCPSDSKKEKTSDTVSL